MQRVQHVVRDARADHLQEHGRRHRQAEPHDRRVGLLDGVAVLERADDDAGHPRQQPVDDERRRVLDEDGRLAQARVVS